MKNVIFFAILNSYLAITHLKLNTSELPLSYGMKEVWLATCLPRNLAALAWMCWQFACEVVSLAGQVPGCWHLERSKQTVVTLSSEIIMVNEYIKLTCTLFDINRIKMKIRYWNKVAGSRLFIFHVHNSKC